MTTANANPAVRPASTSVWRILWRLITFRPALYVAAVALWSLRNMMDLVPGLLKKVFFDKLTAPTGVALTVEGIALLALIAGVVHVVTILSYGWLNARFHFTLVTLLRRNLLRMILRRPGAQPLGRSPGEALNTIRDDVQELDDATQWTIDILAQILFLVTALGILLSISVPLTLLVAVPMMIIVFAAQRSASQIKRYRLAARDATQRVTGAMGELFSAVQAIQLSGANDHVLRHLSRLNDDRRRMVVNDRLFTQVLNSIYGYGATIGEGLILLAAASALRDQSITFGDLALFLAYIPVLSTFMMGIGYAFTQNRQAAASVQRLSAFVSPTPALDIAQHDTIRLSDVPADGFGPQPTVTDRLDALRVENLTCLHHAQDGASASGGIRDVSFTIRRGQLTVITGAVGSGKTTLLRAMLGLLPIQSGALYWNEQRINAPGEVMIPPRCAYTPQVPTLISATIRENLLLGLSAESAELEQAIWRAVFEQDVADMPDGLDTEIGTRGLRLSGGQAQRTAAARMFLRRPQVYVFDDLSSALDVNTERLLWEHLLTGDEPPTCVAVSHRRAVLKRADQVIVLKDGLLADCGRLDDLLTRCDEIQRLWRAAAE